MNWIINKNVIKRRLFIFVLFFIYINFKIIVFIIYYTICNPCNTTCIYIQYIKTTPTQNSTSTLSKNDGISYKQQYIQTIRYHTKVKPSHPLTIQTIDVVWTNSQNNIKYLEHIDMHRFNKFQHSFYPWHFLKASNIWLSEDPSNHIRIHIYTFWQFTLLIAELR